MRPRLHLDSAPFTSFPSTVLLLDPASFFPLPLPPVSAIPSAVPSSPASLDSSAAVSVEASSAVDATWKEREHSHCYMTIMQVCQCIPQYMPIISAPGGKGKKTRSSRAYWPKRV